MGELFLNIGIVLALIMVEGLFVAAEIALVSLREGQVRALAESGARGAAVSRLVGDPNRFLAAVQIGVTSTALLSSAFGAVTISDEVGEFLVGHGWSAGLATATGVVAVTLVISFVTLVVGELAPKRLGLQRAERTALLFGRPLERLAAFFRPVIWLLSRSTNAMVRVLGGDPHASRAPITEEELRGLVAAHESLGADERTLIDEVFAAGERSLDEVMVPRTEVTFLESTMTLHRAAQVAAASPHSRYPVVGRGQDDVLGFLHIRDLLEPAMRHERDRTVASVVRPVVSLPGSKPVLAAMSELRREGHHLAIVVDEYGGTDGIVTLEDLIEEVIGDIRDEYDSDLDAVRPLASGDVEVGGLLNLDEVHEQSGVELPDGPYSTLGGFVMARLGRLPEVGDCVESDGLQLTVVRMDGRRVARVRLTRTEPAPVEESAV
ncbi:hemolysin family protein [Jatrophihabitans fulvus]